MSKKIVIAGGTGFIGTYLNQKFSDLGYEVIIISRQKNHVNWNNEKSILNAIDNAEVLINLAGKSVDCRYSEKNKNAILNSRVETTKILGDVILKCTNPPELWINSSTATIYRHSEDIPMTEKDGEIGTGFSVNVAKKWEQIFFDFKLTNTRQIALRISIVLGKNGGAMQPLLTITKLGMGGKQGNGNQMFSWIHIEDLYQVILFCINNKNIKGAINCTAPNPIQNKVLMEKLRKKCHVNIGIPTPKWVLKMGAFIINTDAELVLKSRWVIPDYLQNNGFVFQYPTIDLALENVLIIVLL